MRRRSSLMVSILALLAVGSPTVAQEEPLCEVGGCPRLFPAIHCIDDLGEVEELEEDEETGELETVVKHFFDIYLSVTNQCHNSIIPNINFFIPGDWVPPFSFDPGTHVVQRITVDRVEVPEVQWFLGCDDLRIDLTDLDPRHLSCSKLQGPQGEPGPEGPPGAAAFAACAKIEEAAAGTVAVAACPEGSVVVAGGGACDNTLPLHPVAWDVGQIQSSFPPDLTSWQVTCRIGHATAHAICCEAP